MTTPPRPRIGVAVIVTNGSQILLGHRQSSHGAGSWQFPGGHLEYGEAIETCARREVEEETGLALGNIRLGPYTNDLFETEQLHYVTLYAIAEYIGGTPELREPEKCAEWRWFAPDALPEPLFLPIVNLLASGGLRTILQKNW